MFIIIKSTFITKTLMCEIIVTSVQYIMIYG